MRRGVPGRGLRALVKVEAEGRARPVSPRTCRCRRGPRERSPYQAPHDRRIREQVVGDLLPFERLLLNQPPGTTEIPNDSKSVELIRYAVERVISAGYCVVMVAHHNSG